MTDTPPRPGSGLESWLRSAASGNDADPEAVALWGELVGLRARVPELEAELAFLNEKYQIRREDARLCQERARDQRWAG